MAASDQTRRVSIRVADHETDVALPARIPIGELMPAVVDVVGADRFIGGDPHLARVCGERLDPAATLAECTIVDGDLLIVTSELEPAPITRFDPSAVIEDAIAALPQPVWRLTQHSAAWWTLGWAGTALLVSLARPILISDASRYPVIGALATLAVLASAIATHRVMSASVAPVSLAVLATAFAGVTAALADPGQPGMSTVLLAAAAISSASLLGWRLLRCAPSVFLPIATAAMTATIAAVGAVLTWWPTATVGPMMAAAALAVLAVSARLAVHSAGLATAGSDTHLVAGARVAHRRLTVIVVAAAWTAALGAALAAVTTAHPGATAVFIAIVAAVLLIRIRRRDDVYRIVAQSLSVLIAVTTLACLCITKAPASTPWLCGAFLLIAVGAVGAAQRKPRRFSPSVRRAMSVLELVLGASIAPAGCAAAGLVTRLPGIGLPL